LGEALLYSGSDSIDKNGITGIGYLTLLNFVPGKEISRDTKMYMNYLCDLNV